MNLNDLSIDVNERHAELVRNLAKDGQQIAKEVSLIEFQIIRDLTQLTRVAANGLDELISFYVKSGGSPIMAHCVHMGIGVVGELGELLDAIKKHVIYQKPLDRENVIEEVGDILFYTRGLTFSDEYEDAFKACVEDERFKRLLSWLDIDVNQCLEANISKLQKRYSTGTYTDEHAQTRADKLALDIE